MRRSRILLILAALALAFASGPVTAAPPKSAPRTASAYDDLVKLFKEFREFQKPVVKDGAPDYGPAAIQALWKGLQDFQKKLAAIDPSGWAIPERVDHMLVRAQMNGLEFDHRVLRPWSRDPAWWIVVEFQFGPKMHGPIDLPRLPMDKAAAEALRAKLRAVPRILEQARKNLTEPRADLTLLGIRAKNRESGMLRDFAERAKPDHPDLVPDIERARSAVDDFRVWLEARRDRWKGPSGIGVENYDWYLRNVQLLPYTWAELRAISEREYERAMAMIKLEEHRNRALPPLKVVEDPAEFLRLYNESQKYLVDFLRDEEVMTVPEWLKPRLIENFRPSPVRDYFANIQVRDPLPLQPHDTVGHGPDEIRHSQDRRVIRGADPIYFIDGTRGEALATGMEEILMHLGMLERRPRARELDYNLLAFRAARSLSDLKMHANELGLTEGFRFNVEMTPSGWLPGDSPTMWHDIELYLRQPTYGVGYLIGSVELQKLIADRGRQLGDGFVLREFMDAFTASGMIPISLIRWEMTGLDDEIRKFF